jgi:hypothetical protein
LVPIYNGRSHRDLLSGCFGQRRVGVDAPAWRVISDTLFISYKRLHVKDELLGILGFERRLLTPPDALKIVGAVMFDFALSAFLGKLTEEFRSMLCKRLLSPTPA